LEVESCLPWLLAALVSLVAVCAAVRALLLADTQEPWWTRSGGWRSVAELRRCKARRADVAPAPSASGRAALYFAVSRPLIGLAVSRRGGGFPAGHALRVAEGTAPQAGMMLLKTTVAFLALLGWVSLAQAHSWPKPTGSGRDQHSEFLQKSAEFVEA